MTLGSLASGVSLALTTVREHKMRSFLTVLGVIIGTGAVIGVGSIIAGLDGAITNILKSFGPNTIVVLRGSGFGGFTLEEQKRKMLTREDALAIEERCPSVEHVSPYLFSNWDQIHKARYKATTTTTWTSAGPKKATQPAARSCCKAASLPIPRAGTTCPWSWSAKTWANRGSRARTR